MTAIKIKMKRGCISSNSLEEIEQIFIIGCKNPGYFKKEVLHDFLKSNPNSITVDIWPYPYLQPAISPKGEKYVRSTADHTPEFAK